MSKGNELQPIASTTSPEDQEIQYVHEVYDQIAPHFSQTRYKVNPIFIPFATLKAPYPNSSSCLRYLSSHMLLELLVVLLLLSDGLAATTLVHIANTPGGHFGFN